MTDSSTDARATMEALDREECVALLRAFTVGRVALVSSDGTPLVLPVNYVVDEEVVVFRSGPGEKLEQIHGAPASFQIDFIDSYHRSGWSVLVQGTAFHASAEEIAHLAVTPWLEGEMRHWVRLVPRSITGRRLVPPDIPLDVRGYR